MLLTLFKLYSQHLPYYYTSNNITVYNENGKEFRFPFTGGLKHPVFNMLDLNGDGYNDLIILDRMDDRILTYTNIGIKDSFGFVYRSQYELLLPDSLTSTIIIKDYNKDGKPDLFAYANSGFVVYKNVSTQSQIKFEVVANPIKSSYFGNQESPVFFLSGDIPAIEDIDGDGDLDILTFTITPNVVEYHKNQSQELFHNSDSLKFKLSADCWGIFLEGSTNHLTLNLDTSNCDVLDHINHSISNPIDNNSLLTPTRHMGSTFMANDMDNDGDVDIVLGDVGYPGLILLKNGKKEMSLMRDKIISYDTNFPKGTKPVHIRQMPGVFYLDLDNESIKDMVVSPMDISLPDTIDGLHQIWLYKNLGTNNDPKFSFIKNDFLQDEMIDLGGATQPVFFDYDHDGDQDLFIVTSGNYSENLHQHDRIVLFENTGNSNKAEFRLKNNDFLGLSSKNYKFLTLAFGDIDGDQKPDMILGKMDGTISYYKNITYGNDTAHFQFVTDILDSIDVGSFSCPFVFDINADNYGDLFIGHGQGHGEISFYSNTGKINNPEFKLITPTFAGITFGYDQHYTTPVVSDLNKNGKPELIFTHNYYNSAYGKVIGDIGFIEDVDYDTSSKYQVQYNRIKDSYSQEIVTQHPGRLLRPAFADLDGDGIPDMILGSSRGGLMLYTTMRDTLNIGMKEQNKSQNYNIPVYPNPARDVLNINLSGLAGSYFLELNDLTGKTILTKTINCGYQVQLKISSIPQGFYVIKLHDICSGNYYYKKVIIQ